ncbi:hypothetical protein B0H13DRAFT_1866156 [Mycena leptocephala]|nr:hypothetical protein B0H13DRAFT_1866156 [Mycena leptocephala]
MPGPLTGWTRRIMSGLLRRTRGANLPEVRAMAMTDCYVHNRFTSQRAAAARCMASTEVLRSEVDTYYWRRCSRGGAGDRNGWAGGWGQYGSRSAPVSPEAGRGADRRLGSKSECRLISRTAVAVGHSEGIEWGSDYQLPPRANIPFLQGIQFELRALHICTMQFWTVGPSCLCNERHREIPIHLGKSWQRRELHSLPPSKETSKDAVNHNSDEEEVISASGGHQSTTQCFDLRLRHTFCNDPNNGEFGVWGVVDDEEGLVCCNDGRSHVGGLLIWRRQTVTFGGGDKNNQSNGILRGGVTHQVIRQVFQKFLVWMGLS